MDKGENVTWHNIGEHNRFKNNPQLLKAFHTEYGSAFTSKHTNVTAAVQFLCAQNNRVTE